MPVFSEQLAAARKAAHMTQEQLADAVHVARSTVSSWENGRTQPDLDTLRLLGTTLNFDFMKGEALTEAGYAETGADVPPASGQIPAAAEQTAPEKKFFSSKRNIILCAAALAAVVIIALLILIPRMNGQPKAAEYKDSSGKVYTIADYQTATPNEEGKAWLTITTTLEKQNTSYGGHFMYTFMMKEENGIGFTIDRMEHVNFFYSPGVSVDTFTADDVRAWGDDPEIKPYGVYELQCGINAKTPSGEPNAIGAGFQVWITDENGEQLTFTSYIPLPQD